MRVVLILALGMMSAGIGPVGAGEPAAGASTMSPRQEALFAMVTPEFLAPWDVEDGLDRLVPRPTGPGNAALNFKNLEKHYATDKVQGKASVRPDAAGLAEFAAAGQTALCRFVPDAYPPVTSGESAQPDYVILIAYARAALDHAEQLSRDGYALEAERAFHIVLNAARHMTTDSPSLIVYMAGLSTKFRAATRYARFLRDYRRHDESRVAEEYTKVLRDRLTLLSAKAQLCLGEFQNFNCIYSAVKIAREDKSLFWRQEAVIRLGVLRWGAPNAFRTDESDKPVMEHDQALQQLAQQALIWVQENDPVPSMRELAKWSFQHLTPERFVEMRHKQLVIKNVAE